MLRNKMKIEVWTDVSCPFCYIGKQRLEKALVEFDHKNQVEVIYRAFPLDPIAPRETTSSIYEYIAKKYGISTEQVKAWCKDITLQSQEDGIKFDFERLVPTNSMDALRLMLFAQEVGKGSEAIHELYKVLFEEGVNLSNHDELKKVATKLGLNKEEVNELLSSELYSEKLVNDYNEAINIGVRGVPYYRINNEITFSGAQPVEAFTRVLEESWTNQLQDAVKQETKDACNDGECYF